MGNVSAWTTDRNGVVSLVMNPKGHRQPKGQPSGGQFRTVNRPEDPEVETVPPIALSPAGEPDERFAPNVFRASASLARWGKRWGVEHGWEATPTWVGIEMGSRPEKAPSLIVADAAAPVLWGSVIARMLNKGEVGSVVGEALFCTLVESSASQVNTKVRDDLKFLEPLVALSLYEVRQRVASGGSEGEPAEAEKLLSDLAAIPTEKERDASQFVDDVSMYQTDPHDSWRRFAKECLNTERVQRSGLVVSRYPLSSDEFKRHSRLGAGYGDHGIPATLYDRYVNVGLTPGFYCDYGMMAQVMLAKAALASRDFVSLQDWWVQQGIVSTDDDLPQRLLSYMGSQPQTPSARRDAKNAGAAFAAIWKKCPRRDGSESSTVQLREHMRRQRQFAEGMSDVSRNAAKGIAKKGAERIKKMVAPYPPGKEIAAIVDSQQ